MVDLFSVSNLTLEDQLETKPLRGWKQSGDFRVTAGMGARMERSSRRGGAGRGERRL